MDTPMVLEPLISSVKRFADPEHVNESYLLFGHGDGGGGPTRNMLEVLRRCEDFPGVPRTQQRSSEEFFSRLDTAARLVPTVVGELYFEMHRATYTTQAANKRNNRLSEHLMRNVEFLSQVNQARNKARYPQEEIERLWKLVLLHQFHDILPGSSINEVYRESDRDYAEVFASGGKLLAQALSTAGGAKPGAGLVPVAVNSCGWARTGLAELTVEKGVKLPEPVQKSHRGAGLYAVTAPSMGLAPVRQKVVEDRATVKRKGTRLVLENQQLRAEFNAQGTLSRLRSHSAGRDYLIGDRPGNQFVLFDDQPTAWDAWDVDVFHLETREELPPAKEVRILEQGPLRSGIEIRWEFGSSTLLQRVFLCAGAAQLEFECELDWHERHRFLKVEFPVNIHATEATYEIQYGLVKRPTHFNTMYDIARFEVSGHRWIDFSEGSAGVALFTDCKYGYAVHENVMRISLVRGSTVPDPEADQGRHVFRYAIYPHAGDYRAAEVLRRAHEFNNPWLLGQGAEQELSLFRVDSGDMVIDAVKKAEDGAGTVVRLYEAHGTRGRAQLVTALPFKKALAVNLLEQKQHVLAVKNGTVELEYKPFEIITVLLV